MSLIRSVLAFLVVVAAFSLPLVLRINSAMLEILIIMCVFIMYSSAWNLLTYSGQGSLGHAAFLGLGAYSSVLTAKFLNLSGLWAINVGGSLVLIQSTILTVFVGGLFAAVVGVFIGLTCVRLREWFLAMVTFGFAVIIHTVTLELKEITGGHDGLPTKHLVSITDSQITDPFVKTLMRYQIEYYVILVFALFVIYVIDRVLKSKVGLAFEAIRENELEAKVMGINTVKYKLIGFALSAFFTGVAGALMIHHTGYLTPEIYSVENSFRPIIYCISGGLFTVEGPIIGTFIITVIWDGLKSFGLVYEHLVIIGLILILTIIFLPRGFVSIPGKIRSRFRSGS